MLESFLGLVTTIHDGDMTTMLARSPAPLIFTCPPAHMAATRNSPGSRVAEWLPLPHWPATSTG
eukprot:1950206-Heterocapsa_arctica.AAC.1